jgi:hypothetical protein
MDFHVARVSEGSSDKNTLVLVRERLAHISTILRSNSGAVPLGNLSYRVFLPGGEVREGTSDEDGFLEEADLPPGDYPMEIEGLTDRFVVPTTPVHIRRRPIRVPGYFLMPSEESTSEDGPSDHDTSCEDEAVVQDEAEWESLEEFEDQRFEDA